MAKLREALELIIEECMRHEDCVRCPLRTTDGGCEVGEAYPYEWRLKKCEEFPARIFE